MDLTDAWILTWGFLYVFNAILKPDAIVKPKNNKYLQAILFLCFGLIIISSLYLDNPFLYLALGVFMSIGWVTSYYSLIVWNVPINHQSLAQMTMAVLDLVSAVVFFSKAIV